MTQAPIRIAFLTIAFVAWSMTASAADCERRIAASGSSSRTVVLAGGEAWPLFRQFLSEIERRDLDVSLWSTKVRLSRGGEIETFELGWTKKFGSESAETLGSTPWARSVRTLNPRLLSDAHESGWDVVCAGTIAEPRNGGDAVVFFKSGVQYASRRDYSNALKEFKAAERIAPRFQGLMMNLGVTYLQLKDYANASSYLKRAVTQDPKDPAAHYNLACLQARLGQKNDAIASLVAARSNGMKMTANVRRDPDLQPLYGRTDFETLFK